MQTKVATSQQFALVVERQYPWNFPVFCFIQHLDPCERAVRDQATLNRKIQSTAQKCKFASCFCGRNARAHTGIFKSIDPESVEIVGACVSEVLEENLLRAQIPKTRAGTVNLSDIRFEKISKARDLGWIDYYSAGGNFRFSSEQQSFGITLVPPSTSLSVVSQSPMEAKLWLQF